jgi:hypothetical protein
VDAPAALMPFYVFALTDTAPVGPAGRGLGASLAFRPVAGAFAAVERRADVPPVELGSLRSHQRVVEQLAARVPAILPVRFGTLLTSDEIGEALDERDDELAEAFELVRGRQQLTWRTRGGTRQSAGVAPSGGREGLSGADYLRRAHRASTPALPKTFRRVRDAAGRLAAAERYQPRTLTLPESLYHLVDRTRLEAYERATQALRSRPATLIVSGPWAPYAFVPDLF